MTKRARISQAQLRTRYSELRDNETLAFVCFFSSPFGAGANEKLDYGIRLPHLVWAPS
jgi:hypothetical protein